MKIKRLTDRTSEFIATVKATPAHPLSQPHSPPITNTNTNKIERGEEEDQFTLQATRIWTAINQITNRLSGSNKECNAAEAVTDCKQDISFLNTQIDALSAHQNTHNTTAQSPTPTQSHRKLIITSLQSRLADCSRQLATLLQAHNENIKSTSVRRDHFSAINNSKARAPPSHPAPQLSNHQRQRKLNSNNNDNAAYTAIDIDGDAQSSSLQSLSLLNHSRPQSSTTSAMDKRYASARATALSTMESTLSELGTMYTHLASLVSQQGESIQRIDHNLDQTYANLEAGQGELQRYLRGVGGRRWLMVKIFGLLIFFILLYALFLF